MAHCERSQSLGSPYQSASLVVALTAVLALVVVMVMEAVVGGMGFDGNPFLLDPESVPRVVGLSSPLPAISDTFLSH